MTDKLRRTHPLNITFADGEAPSAAKLNAVAKQARVGARVLESVVGDVWNQSGDSLLNDWPLQIPNLARTIGQLEYLNPDIYPPSETFTYIDTIGANTPGANQGYLQFKPTALSAVSVYAGSNLTDKKSSETDITNAGDWWVDEDTGRWRSYSALGTSDVLQYTVNPAEWAVTSETLPGVIPDPRQTAFTGCKISSSGGRFYLHLPPRMPLDTEDFERPERYPPTTGNALSYNSALTTSETRRLWQSSSVTALAAEHYRYRLPKEIIDVISSLGSGATLPAGFLYLWDQSQRTIVEDVVFKTSSQGNWVLEISSSSVDFSSKVTTVETDTAYNSTNYSLIVVGSPIARVIHSLSKVIYSGTHNNSGDFSPLIAHSSLTGQNPPPYSLSYNPEIPTTLPSWLPSRYTNDDHVYLLSRAGSRGITSDYRRDDYDNAMLGDFLLSASQADGSNWLNLVYSSNRIYFGKADSTTAPNIYGAGASVKHLKLDGSTIDFHDSANPTYYGRITITSTSATFSATTANLSYGTFGSATLDDSSSYALTVTGKTSAPIKAGLRLVPQSAQPTGPNQIGDIYVTTAGVLKICTVAGTPGTWVSVGAQT